MKRHLVQLSASSAAIALAAAALFGSAETRKSPLPSDLQLVRDWQTSFVCVAVADVLEDEQFKTLPVRYKSLLEQAGAATGIKAAEVERLTVVAPTFNVPPVALVRTRKAFDVVKLTAALTPGAKPTKVGGRQFFRGEGGPAAVAVIDGRTFAVGDANTLAALVGKPAAKESAFPEELLTGKSWISAGLNPRDVTALLTPEARVWSEDDGAVRNSSPTALPIAALPLKPFLQAKWIALEVAPPTANGSRVEARFFYASDRDVRYGEAAAVTAFCLMRDGPASIVAESNGAAAKALPRTYKVVSAVSTACAKADVERRGKTIEARLVLPLTVPEVVEAVDEVIGRRASQLSMENLRLIGLAMMEFADSQRCFPAAAICDKVGKPLLSWRVAILPFIEEGRLFSEFKLDEPWDGPNNIKLLPRMPKFYVALEGDPSVARHETFYRCFVGESAAFRPFGPRAANMLEGRGLDDFPDGRQQTLAVVEAAIAVPWSKPDELAYDPEKPLPKLGGPFKTHFHALFFDGRTVKIPVTIREKTLRALITPAGKEKIDMKEVESPEESQR